MVPMRSRRSRWVASGSSRRLTLPPHPHGPGRPRPPANCRSKSDRRMPDLDEVFRKEAGRCTATLIRVLGDIDLAEDAVAEAFAIAADRWATDGIPPNPGGWITTTARNRAIDRLRRESTRDDRHLAAHRLHGTADDAEEDPDMP